MEPRRTRRTHKSAMIRLRQLTLDCAVAYDAAQSQLPTMPTRPLHRCGSIVARGPRRNNGYECNSARYSAMLAFIDKHTNTNTHNTYKTREQMLSHSHSRLIRGSGVILAVEFTAAEVEVEARAHDARA